MGFSPQKGLTGVFYTNADWIGLALSPLHKTKKWACTQLDLVMLPPSNAQAQVITFW